MQSAWFYPLHALTFKALGLSPDVQQVKYFQVDDPVAKVMSHPGKGRSIEHFNPKLFSPFTPERLQGFLPLIHLATGKLPQPTLVGIGVPELDQDQAPGVSQDPSDHVDYGNQDAVTRFQRLGIS